MKDLLTLTEDLYLGRGCHKATYVHPEDSSKCVKVLICDKPEAKKQLAREIKHNLALQKKYPDLEEVAKYRGEVETNLGRGYVWDLVRNADGTVAVPLDEYIKSGKFMEDEGRELERTILELGAAMLKKEIIPMDLKPRNIFCRVKEDGKIKLVIIDDLGTAAIIPFEYYFSFAAHGRIKRRWNRMMDHYSMRQANDSELYRGILSRCKL